MTHTINPHDLEPNLEASKFSEELITLPALSVAGRTFNVVPLSSATYQTRSFINEYGPDFKLIVRAFNPKMDEFYILLSSAEDKVGKWIDEDEVLLVANFGETT